jgi:hypothetical protein
MHLSMAPTLHWRINSLVCLQEDSPTSWSSLLVKHFREHSIDESTIIVQCFPPSPCHLWPLLAKTFVHSYSQSFRVNAQAPHHCTPTVSQGVA